MMLSTPCLRPPFTSGAEWYAPGYGLVKGADGPSPCPVNTSSPGGILQGDQIVLKPLCLACPPGTWAPAPGTSKCCE